MAIPANDLRDDSTATRFYEDRFSRGYMGGWPQAKRARVELLVRELALPSHGRALDFGCGAGVFTEVLAKALPGWEIEGTDLSSTAVEQARQRLPNLTFFPLSNCEQIEGTYDFVFTHHVLEHVSDIGATANLVARMLKPHSSMFHILPCGDAGSFAHWVCTLRIDGIDRERESRFFFEEEGHLRRLNTASLVALWKGAGFREARAWYANHRVATIAWLSRANWEDVVHFADPVAGTSAAARRQLWAMRIGLLALWALRKPVTIIRHKMSYGCHGPRDYALLALAILTTPIAWPVDKLVRYLDQREWERRKGEMGGAEMYLHLVRPASGV